MRTHLLPLFVLLAAVLFSSSAVHGGRKDPVGGWTPIKDLKDSHVKEIGEFAINEHNKEAKTLLVFNGVVSGESQIVSGGTNYKLVLSAKDGSATTNNRYQAVVWEKLWMHFKNLTSFIKSDVK